MEEQVLQRSFHHKLMKTYFAMHRRVMSAAKELGLTSGQPKILEYLSEQEGVEQKTIARSCEIESATVGSILDRTPLTFDAVYSMPDERGFAAAQGFPVDGHGPGCRRIDERLDEVIFALVKKRIVYAHSLR